MSPVDGWEVNRLLKADSQTASIPVIITSGAVMQRESERAREERCFAFLSKPLTLDVVGFVIDEASRRRKSQLATVSYGVDWYSVGFATAPLLAPPGAAV